MSTPFGKDGGPVQKVGRNSWDLSHQTNGTYNFGGIYPVLVQEVIPGDHFKIDTTFGLRFMPTGFPLQTRMRADIHYFYVRNRGLYEDWMDHYGMKSYGTQSKQTVPPFISPQNARNKDMFATGSLGDYLGLPTTLVGKYGNSSKVNVTQYGLRLSNPVPYFEGFYFGGEPADFAVLSNIDHPAVPPSSINIAVREYSLQPAGTAKIRVRHTPIPSGVSLAPVPMQAVFGVGSGYGEGDVCSLYSCGLDEEYIEENIEIGGVPFVRSLHIYPDPKDADYTIFEVQTSIPCFISLGFGFTNFLPTYGEFSNVPFQVVDTYATEVRDVIDVVGANIPWEIKPIDAYVFRAYEMIYNSFYRDERNNPYVLNGEVQYNKYLPTTAGGEDKNIYKLHYRNWEQDFLTTAVPTPQMGPAPLVGISSLGEMSIQDPESGQVYKVMAKTADDADTIVGMDVTETLPNTVMRSLVNYASSGISINDFRNVNAFQRWLETNIRKGFKYKDQIKSHYDVDIRFDELLMPEFIGGASIDIMPTTVTQTSQDTQDNPLGSYAGQLYGSGSSKHPVSQYCDEHGFIIGLLSVVPVPNYSQLMPKHFWKSDSLDYFSPEFGHIGLQPIPSREVCPIQMAQSNPDDFEKGVFGYQRGWYDYLQRTDEVHGQFRNTLRNFVMNRVFDSKPELGPSFTVIDPKHLNDVFTVQHYTDPDTGEEILVDKIIGQIYFDISAKRPIPKYGIPRLE